MYKDKIRMYIDRINENYLYKEYCHYKYFFHIVYNVEQNKVYYRIERDTDYTHDVCYESEKIREIYIYIIAIYDTINSISIFNN